MKLNSLLAGKEARDGPPNCGRHEFDHIPPNLRRYVLWPEEGLQDKKSQNVRHMKKQL